MVPSRLLSAFLLAGTLLVLAGCPHTYKRPYTEPAAAEIMEHLAAQRAALRSYKVTDATMDYWVGKDRFRGTVMVMGVTGSKVRMNALRPDNAVAADLSCDGTNYALSDKMNNCVLEGPCNADSIASLLRVPLEPDDFLYLALGATPVIPDATGKVRWDAKRGAEVLELEGSAGLKQTVVLDGRSGDKTWDILETTVKGPDGKVIWTAAHTKYVVVTDEQGNPHRVPGKSNIKTPSDKSDLLVEWGSERWINLELEDIVFEQVLDPVPMCGTKAE